MKVIRLASSRKLLERAQRRILNIAQRDDLTTTDPLRAEIALAQATATMALAQSINEVKEVIKDVTSIEVQRSDPFAQSTAYNTNRRISELEQEIDKLRSELSSDAAKPARAASPEQPKQSNPWWRRF